MFARIPWRSLIVGALCLAPLGCDHTKSFLRPKDDDDVLKTNAVDEDEKPTKVLGGNASDADARSFFKNDRRAGGWSSEAQEIESHLGAS
jgi:hypothetical protein